MFDQINNLFEKKQKPEKVDAPFMVNRFLSMYSKTFLLAVELNKRLSRLPSWAVASFLWINVLYERPAPRISYIKKDKKIKSVDDKYIKVIGKNLCCSDFHAKEILLLLKKEKFDYKSYFGQMVKK